MTRTTGSLGKERVQAERVSDPAEKKPFETGLFKEANIPAIFQRTHLPERFAQIDGNCHRVTWTYLEMVVGHSVDATQTETLTGRIYQIVFLPLTKKTSSSKLENYNYKL